MKRMRQSERIERDVRDRLSDLPDLVLLHIMKFMNVKDAIQTSLLSKRWKGLWKCLPNLTLLASDFSTRSSFWNFVSSVLSCRDDSSSLLDLDLRGTGCIEPKLLNRVMTYAVSHDVHQLMINVGLNLKKDFELPSCVFYCRSLTSLNLSLWIPCTHEDGKIQLPKSLELPALKSLHIEYVTFATRDNGCAEPFSKCKMLNTLVIQHCYLQSDAKVLHISNSKLCSLTIMSYRGLQNAYEITLSTPNLDLLTMKGDHLHQLSSTCNIACLEEVNIHVHCYEDFPANGLVLIRWLQVLVNVTIMTLSWSTPKNKIQLPKSLKLPALKSLHIEHVTFATSDNGCAEPFSTCHMLNTLVIEHCYLKRDAKILCVSNSKLSNLTVISYSGWGKAYEIMLSTPNLNLLTLDGDPLLEPTSTCNISCLEEVNINVQKDFLMRFILISWLQVLANVKMMTLSRSTFEILNDLLSHGSMRSLLPCFVRLKSLKLDSDIPDQKVSRVVEYLLQNSPLTRVDIIKYLTLEEF